MMRTGRILGASAMIACLALSAGCSSGGDGGGSTGTVSLFLMDRAVDDVTELHVTISEVWIKPSDGPAFALPMTTTPLSVNLLELDPDSASVLVDEAVIDAGSYDWVEFVILDSDIADSYAITLSGGMVPVDVDVPSGRIHLGGGFDLADNEAVRILFDWDVRKGLTYAVGRNVLLLRPAFRILDVSPVSPSASDALSGMVSGTISAATIAADEICQYLGDPVVYFFEGDVIPDDYDGEPPEAVTTVDATLVPGTSDYEYTAILAPGEYTVAFTCLGQFDADDTDDDLVFLEPLTPGTIIIDAETPLEGVDF